MPQKEDCSGEGLCDSSSRCATQRNMESSGNTRLSAGKHPYSVSRLLMGAGLAWVILGLASSIFIPRNISYQTIQRISDCRSPSIRREWRELSEEEKGEYINAVQCLRAIPSELEPTRAIYDDFPWVHSRIGSGSHGTAAFLAWHRYFIHVYETALKERCDYTGSLAYWDWSLDWQNFTESPIWHSKTGFGGNGNSSGAITVGHGSCLIDGPFANVTALFYGMDDENVHCLSRGFRSGEDLSRLCSDDIRPDVIETIIRFQDYESFNLGLEHRAHRAIPNCVQGDWLSFSVPFGMYYHWAEFIVKIVGW